ncbi:MAG: YraN family protein [Synechococcus sp. SB0668_bin_15]|nr:YraN family protein [Synechococcus sp. SB0668_bin_15]MYC49068.1 YraN family protein [Synechococcus sp. SB0662_bin_14]
MSTSSERGLAAEQRVATVLTFQGWEVLERRWRCRHGEMDLLLHQDGRLLIVEVKCRNAAGLAFVDGAGNCLGWRQQQRLRLAFGLWLQRSPQWSHCGVAVALAVVVGDQIFWTGLGDSMAERR